MGPTDYRGECLQCVWQSGEDNCRKSDHSIEDSMVIDKILSHLERSCIPTAGSAKRACASRAALLRVCLPPEEPRGPARDGRWFMLIILPLAGPE